METVRNWERSSIFIFFLAKLINGLNIYHLISRSFQLFPLNSSNICKSDIDGYRYSMFMKAGFSCVSSNLICQQKLVWISNQARIKTFSYIFHWKCCHLSGFRNWNFQNTDLSYSNLLEYSVGNDGQIVKKTDSSFHQIFTYLNICFS